jgi:CRP-like cAMP-binding protein
VIALTNVEAYSIDKNSFIRLISNSVVEKNIRKLASTRDETTWTAIKSNPFFKNLSSSQVTQLESMLSLVEIKKETVLFKERQKTDHVYILIEGCVEILKRKKGTLRCNKGEIIGDIFAIRDNKPIGDTYRAKENTKLYRIEGKSMLSFLAENPGVFMNLIFEKGEIS